MEQWKDVVGYEGLYQVSSHGRVKTLVGRYAGRKYLVQTMSGTYPTVQLYKNKKRKTTTIHSLVASHFLKKKFPTDIILHGDGDGKNNRVSNLRYGTYKENEQDKKKHGTLARGEKQGASKLKTADVIEIKKELSCKGRICAALARKYGVTASTIKSIKRGVTWSWVNV